MTSRRVAKSLRFVGLALVTISARERAWPVAGVFAAMAALPIVAFFLYLGARMPAGLAWKGVLGNWVYLGSEPLGDPFYARIAEVEILSPARYKAK